VVDDLLLNGMLVQAQVEIMLVVVEVISQAGGIMP
jgi:hypothetical protein